MIRISIAAALAVMLAAPALVAQDRPAVAKAVAKAAATAVATAAAPLNVNTATLPQLETLPGIGRATAERILEYRQKNGPFKKIEELMNIRGIGEKSFLKLKPMISVAPASEQTAQAR